MLSAGNKTVEQVMFISTQVRENYGSEEEPYWKTKGGEDYIIGQSVVTHPDAEAIIDAIRRAIEVDSAFWEEFIVHEKMTSTDRLDFGSMFDPIRLDVKEGDLVIESEFSCGRERFASILQFLVGR